MIVVPVVDTAMTLVGGNRCRESFVAWWSSPFTFLAGPPFFFVRSATRESHIILSPRHLPVRDHFKSFSSMRIPTTTTTLIVSQS